MKKSMDLFGEALYAYTKGDKKSKFFFVDRRGKKYPPSLKRYFRTPKQLTKLERKLISLSKGNILDIGCATGYYLPTLAKRGKVEGIDISEKLIRIAREEGLKNCKAADIFHFKTKKKYDTITLLENGLGMGGTLPKTKELLKILAGLLKKDGQVLNVLKKVTRYKSYFIAELYPKWKDKKGPKFKWINLNVHYLSEMCAKMNLKLGIIDRDRKNYLIKIIKNN